MAISCARCHRLRHAASQQSLRAVRAANRATTPQLKTQTNLGYDLGVDWTPNKTLKMSATAFYEFFTNELVTQATP